jgi:hypothetical protein
VVYYTHTCYELQLCLHVQSSHLAVLSARWELAQLQLWPCSKNRRYNYVDMMRVPRIYHAMHISYVRDDVFRISSSISLVIIANIQYIQL